MNKGHLALIISIACLGVEPVRAASAVQALLTAPIQSLQKEGFYGAKETTISDAVTAPAPVPTANTPDDHIKTVLAALSQEVLSKPVSGDLSGKTARRFGFSPTSSIPWTAAGNMPIGNIGRRKPATGESKSFNATNVRGKTEIILVYMKDNVEIRSYMVSLDGTLGAAVVETTSGIVTDIPADQAQKEFEAELGFWVRYYDKAHPTEAGKP